jgi:mRNA interferase MazF
MYSFRPPNKLRPVLVLTRDGALTALASVTVVPITSSIRGVASEVALNEDDGMKAPCVVNLHNAVTVPQRQLGQRIAHLDASRMSQVCAALRYALGCDQME